MKWYVDKRVRVGRQKRGTLSRLNEFDNFTQAREWFDELPRVAGTSYYLCRANGTLLECK